MLHTRILTLFDPNDFIDFHLCTEHIRTLDGKQMKRELSTRYFMKMN